MSTAVEYAYTAEEWQQRLAGSLAVRARRQRIQATTRGILDRRRRAGLRARHGAKLQREKQQRADPA